MGKVVREIDMTQGHCWPPTLPNIASDNSKTVYAEGFKVVSAGDQYLPHPGPCGNQPPHPVMAIIGSDDVFINLKPVVRDNDILSCGDMAKSQSQTVYINGS